MANSQEKTDAGQRAVDDRRDILDAIPDPQTRAETEQQIREHAQHSSAATESAIERAKANKDRWDKALSALPENSRVRAAGEKLAAAINSRASARIASGVLRDAHKDAAIVTRARKTAADLKQRTPRHPVHDLDRSR